MRCDKCGKEYEERGACRRGDRHQQCVNDRGCDKCEEITMPIKTLPCGCEVCGKTGPITSCVICEEDWSWPDRSDTLLDLSGLNFLKLAKECPARSKDNKCTIRVFVGGHALITCRDNTCSVWHFIKGMAEYK